MKEIIKDTYLTTLGIAAVTFEKAEKISKELVSKKEIAKEKQQKFIEGLLDKARKNLREIDHTVKEKMEMFKEKGQPLLEKQEKAFNELGQKTKKAGEKTEEKIRERFEKAVSELILQSVRIKDKQEKIAQAIKKKVSQRPSSAGTDLDEKIDQSLRKLDIPTQEDLQELKTKIDELSKKIEKEWSS